MLRKQCEYLHCKYVLSQGYVSLDWKICFFYQLLHMLYYLGPKHFPKGTEVIPPDLPTLFKVAHKEIGKEKIISCQNFEKKVFGMAHP